MIQKQENKLEVWQDKQLKFDIYKCDLSLGPGEQLVTQIEHIEDLKGNPTEDGEMQVTNLRIIWYLYHNRACNLSIGYDTIIQIQNKQIDSQLVGCSHQMLLKVRHNNCRFQFLFQSKQNQQNNVFSVFQQVCKVYDNSKTYRNLYRGFELSSPEDKELKLLNIEKVIQSYENCKNYSCEKQSVGRLVCSNIRLMWFNPSTPHSYLSLPWVTIQALSLKDSQYGVIIVANIFKTHGEYVLGFGLQAITQVYQQIVKVFNLYRQKPVLTPSVDYKLQKQDLQLEGQQQRWERQQEDLQIEQEQYNQRGYNQYMEQGEGGHTHQVVYSHELGLAIQKPINTNIQQLWQIIHIPNTQS